MPELLEIEDLFVSYPDGAEAIRGASLAMGAGSRVGLIGPNGAGKTSLLLAILRGVESRGRIVVDGVELGRRTADEVRSRCGMTFQNPDDQLFMPTLLDDAAFGPLNQGCDAGTAQARAREAIAAVGLEGIEERSAHHLSGGQKRGAALATILSMRVKLLLLDEPGASLDVRSRRRLTEILRGRGEAILLATHDLEMVGELCERAVLLDEGRIVADGATSQILGDAALLREHGII
ncbi:MAG TPA: ABC transporter ATP-binding protein [Phycisphaerae bacterium]|nr:ABC transporter ATP-binding protein [Phycisphaerae bacterium]